MTTLGELGKIVAEEIKLVRVEAEEVKTRTEEKIETMSTQLSGSIETDLSEHENKLRNHEAKIDQTLKSSKSLHFYFSSLLEVITSETNRKSKQIEVLQGDLEDLGDDQLLEREEIESQIQNLEADVQKKLDEADPLIALVASLSENN